MIAGVDLDRDVALEDQAELAMGWGSQPGAVKPAPRRIPVMAWLFTALVTLWCAFAGGIVGSILGLAERVTR